ncbi:hypothetical protein MIMGU_mgv1a016612mg [Erythranthe guttata]|uniref:Uncharacterized protein n=1 Tax=Erythranthe guttata TaxID=4155 RepID=A0A022QEA3_ERYGU|nr:hypothetical protein MIMGU_mgv1a016612mg [Erythranthe guttata]
MIMEVSYNLHEFTLEPSLYLHLCFKVQPISIESNITTQFCQQPESTVLTQLHPYQQTESTRSITIFAPPSNLGFSISSGPSSSSTSPDGENPPTAASCRRRRRRRRRGTLPTRS